MSKTSQSKIRGGRESAAAGILCALATAGFTVGCGGGELHAEHSSSTPEPAASAPLERAHWIVETLAPGDAGLDLGLQRVALAWLDRGRTDRTLELADAIRGWRRDVVLAETASWYARNEQLGEAARLLGRSSSARPATQASLSAWNAEALMGRSDALGERLREHGAGPQRGPLAAYHALALARRGQVTRALATLEELANATDAETMGWRAIGYLLLAESVRLAPGSVDDLLATAWEATAAIPGETQLDVQLRIVDAAMGAGQRVQGYAWLEDVTRTATSLLLDPSFAALFVGRVARRWARLGERAQVEELADHVLRTIAGGERVPAARRPHVYALVAEAEAAVGHTDQAWNHYERALDAAGRLSEPLQRGLAALEICLSLDRAGWHDARLEAELARLMGTLEGPYAERARNH